MILKKFKILFTRRTGKIKNLFSISERISNERVKHFLYFLTLLVVLMNILTPLIITHADNSSILNKLENAGGEEGAGYKEQDLASTYGSWIRFFMLFVGVVFLFLMVYGGFLWMNARGNEEQVKKARGLIGQAVIGLAIIFSAYIITYLVVSKLGTAGKYPLTLNQE